MKRERFFFLAARCWNQLETRKIHCCVVCKREESRNRVRERRRLRNMPEPQWNYINFSALIQAQPPPLRRTHDDENWKFENSSRKFLKFTNVWSGFSGVFALYMLRETDRRESVSTMLCGVGKISKLFKWELQSRILITFSVLKYINLQHLIGMRLVRDSKHTAFS